MSDSQLILPNIGFYIRAATNVKKGRPNELTTNYICSGGSGPPPYYAEEEPKQNLNTEPVKKESNPIWYSYRFEDRLSLARS